MSPREWKKYRLEELCETVSITHKFDKDKLIFLNTGDIEKGKFMHCDYSDVRSMPGQAKKTIRKDDILFSEIRPANGRYALVDFDGQDYVVSTKLMVIRANERILPKYLYQFLTSEPTTTSLQHLAELRSGTFPQITFNQVANLEINLPTKPEQKKISDFISALDDKIECNRRINQTLEAMAQALYKHWFVDFGPFRGDEFVDSELGEIPQGWRVQTLGDVVTIESRIVNPQKFPDEEFLHLSIPALDDDFTPTAELGKKILSGKILVDVNSVLVSKLNPRIYRVWTFFPTGNRRAIASSEFIRYVPKRDTSWAFVNCHVRDERLIQEFRTHVTGTTGSRQRVTPERTLEFPCVVPPTEVMQGFEQIVGTYWKQIDANLHENQSLIRTRDYLLPKLLSGEVEVKDAEREIAETL